MDEEEMLNNVVNALIEEGLKDTNNKEESQSSDTSTNEEENATCTCMKDTPKDEKPSTSGSVASFFFDVLPKLDIIGILTLIQPLIKTTSSRNVDPFKLAQLLLKTVPELRKKIQVLQAGKK